jgi:hypothetical protein
LPRWRSVFPMYSSVYINFLCLLLVVIIIEAGEVKVGT